MFYIYSKFTQKYEEYSTLHYKVVVSGTGICFAASVTEWAAASDTSAAGSAGTTVSVSFVAVGSVGATCAFLPFPGGGGW